MAMSAMMASGRSSRSSFKAPCTEPAVTTVWPSSMRMAVSVATVSGSSSTTRRRRESGIAFLGTRLIERCGRLRRRCALEGFNDQREQPVGAERLHEAGEAQRLGALREVRVARDDDDRERGQRAVRDERGGEVEPAQVRQVRVQDDEIDAA